mgnify:CR=1 FL=1
MKGRKADTNLMLSKLPMIIFIIVVAVLILMLISNINKGGFSFIANPPVTKLPIP